ncbi:MAG TPA: sugar transferase [Bryobacteraceae bacterium]|nr:sugar transferase [Bryobacteraceae bacterium]
MFSRHQRKVRVFHLLADGAVVWLAFEMAYQARSVLPLARDFYFLLPVKLLLLLMAALCYWGTALWFGDYESLEGESRRDVLRRTLRQAAVSPAVLVLAQFALRLDMSRLFLALFAGLAGAGLLALRWHWAPVLGWYRRKFGAEHYLWIVGTGDSARRVAGLVEDAAAFGLRLSGFLDKNPAVSMMQLRGEYPVHGLAELPALLRQHVIDEVLFAVPSEQLAELEETFLLCDEEGVRSRVAVDFFPHVHSDVYLDRLGSSPMLTFSGAPHDEVRLLLKRVIDVVLAAASLLLVAPLMAVVAVLVKTTSPGPLLFRQERCGLNGRRFLLYKFRSMVADAEALKAGLADQNERELVFKMKNDPRLTGIGRWLRKFSIDEWPQLWNVLRGDMSLVGPRPAIPCEVEQYKRWQRRRLRMRPGLTCLWVVEGRDTVDFQRWMELDMQYIDNWSLALDWKIMLRTIPQVVIGKGAH